MDRVTRHPMRRVLLAGILLVVLVAVFVVRLVDIQVVSAAELNSRADEVRRVPVTLYGERGAIVDRTGAPLADTVMEYDVAVSPIQAVSGPVETEVPDPDDPGATTVRELTLDEALGELGAVLGVPSPDLRAIVDGALAADPASQHAYLARRVDVATYQRIEALDFPFVYTEEHPARRYPNGAVAGNLIGFVGDDGEPLAGLELSADACLAGRDGEMSYLHSLKDWVAIPGSEVVHEEAAPGGTLRLTIDADLQWQVQRIAEAQVQATGAAWATVTVMEAKTGKLLAVADVPTVDPNDPAAVDAANRGSRAFTAPYEPGSTFKSLTAASVLDAGAGEPGVVAPYRYLAPNGADVNDSFGHEPTRYTMTGVLIDSSNTGMSLFGERLSDEQRYQDMLDFGLGAPTEVGFLAEAAGDLNGGPGEWDNQTKYATMFGQGLTTTAVQIASVYQTIANGGVRMPVTLVEGCDRGEPDGDEGAERDEASAAGTPEGRQVVSEQAADLTAQMLEQVYLEGWLADVWEIPGVRVAAKTGTAQVPDGQGGYQDGFLVSVSGFAPADDPEYVVSVSIMDPVKMNSSAASAPVFRDVMSHVLKKYRTVPSGAEAPELPATW